MQPRDTQRETRPEGRAPRLALRGVSKVFDGPRGRVEALRGVDLTVYEGEFVAIVGPSGCGKSTLLNIVSGLDQPSAGLILLDDAPATSRLGRTAFMPQRDLLLPWRTVLDNAILGLEIAGVPRREARARARALLPRFGLADFADAYPAMLSGGMRQRAALLRTVLPNKSLLLLDEPFGALDALTRAAMQEWLLGLWEDLRRTILFVTHDIEEAVLLADRVLVMSPRPGRIVRDAPVPLPRPRDYTVVTTPEFVVLRAELLAALRAGEGGAG
ncbi:MAG: ABC transporter ATP-binding protein [Sphaerobacter sp.]|nr:ABC transporter ATP-binding protein [Sphaerobacter sp.]